jgi:rhodanese-related sulfurtransferase
VVTSLSPAPDRVHYWPDAQTIVVKLIADRQSRRLLGCQVAGQGDVAKRVDVAATAIGLGATIDQLANLDLAYAPPYSSPIDNLVTAAHIVENKLCGMAQSVSPFDVKQMLDQGDDFVFLDVRIPKEVADRKIPGTLNIPLGRLRASLDGLSPDQQIVTLCAIGLRGYEAQRLLEGRGFRHVRFLDGGLSTWPYETE